MTVLHTLKKQRADPAGHLKSALDAMAADPCLNPFNILFKD